MTTNPGAIGQQQFVPTTPNPALAPAFGEGYQFPANQPFVPPQAFVANDQVTFRQPNSQQVPGVVTQPGTPIAFGEIPGQVVGASSPIVAMPAPGPAYATEPAVAMTESYSPDATPQFGEYEGDDYSGGDGYSE